jgi:LDH2 family malate/lactate/ureidoglycolate dehydrogenase
MPRTVAQLMTEAEVQGSDGHGVIRLVPYARRIRAGGINLRPDIRVVKEKAAMALIDGDNGMGHLVMKQATELAIAKARQCGVAWVGSRLSNHAGPASLYARMALPHDMVGMYFAVGQRQPPAALGRAGHAAVHQPDRGGRARGRRAAVVLDMATTVAAYGKVKAKAQRGEQMPSAG